jgi:hypothetical protein
MFQLVTEIGYSINALFDRIVDSPENLWVLGRDGVC